MIGIVLLCCSLVLLICAIVILFVTRRRLVRYTKVLADDLDALMTGHIVSVDEEEKDTLLGKLQMKMRRLYEIMQERAEINKSDRMLLEANISDLSHQIKTPISNIHMYQSFLQKEHLSGEYRTEFAKALGGQADKLEFLIQSMIKMSRLETGIVKVQPKEENVHDLVEQAVCDVALKAECKEIAIQSFCEEHMTAWFDYKWTLEAVYNILDNAVKYTSENGAIEIRVKITDFFVCIQIRDNGKGIPEEHLTEIFKRFYREPEVHLTEGVGIGLYLAREIITKQKGFIDVQSKEGIGSVFSVHLPLEEV